MKQFLPFICLVLSYGCFGQIENVVENAINFDDIMEIKELMYFKTDTTLVTGTIVRYNRKKQPKQYIEVQEGKPQSHNWINFDENIKDMEYDGLGTLVGIAAAMTGMVFAATGNDHNLPSFQNNNDNQSIYRGPNGNEKTYNEKMDLEREKRMITKNLNSTSKTATLDESKAKIASMEDSKTEMEFPENGLYEEFYDNSKLRRTGHYINGKKNGDWNEWYENGKLMSSVAYIDGKKVGRLNTYHPNGQLKGRVNYVDGKEEGEIMVYNEKGEIMLIGFFNEGIQTGDWNYYEKGTLIKTENFD